MKRIIHLLQLLIITTILILSNGCTNTSIKAMPTVSLPSQPQHVALLLPLTGPLATYAGAIRNGFFTAYYAKQNQGASVPNITVYNTDGKNIRDVYQTAITAGADFVVGPLDKADVLTLANEHHTIVPILALNTTPSDTKINNDVLFEFALSPIDEAQQAAQKAFHDNHRNVIILAPNNLWGQRIANAFTAQWKTLGGNIIATEYYGDMRTVSKNIQDVLQISNSYQNEHQLKNMFGKDMRFIPQRRQDFDSIFLVATPEMGRQIEPLLRFYFAGNIPVYATSQIYAGFPDVNRDNDLNGIYFCEMSWVLAPNQMQSQLQTMQQRIQTLWPQNYARLTKFYAMGVDAFDLISELNNMQSQSSGVPGATGTLYLTPQHTIYRQLMWAQFQNGIPVIQ